MNRPLLLRVGLFAAIALVAVYIGYRVILQGKELPVYSPSELNEELVDSTLQDRSHGHRIGDFAFVDQTGDTVTRDILNDHIAVVNFFFTTCRNICPRMNGLLQEVVQEYQGEDRVIFLSHTVDPEYDTVEVLQDYAEERDADPKHWKFLTGRKKEIYEMARRSYFVAKTEGEGGKSDFIHTENIVLVDQKGRLRGFYDGTSEKDMERLSRDIEILLRSI